MGKYSDRNARKAELLKAKSDLEIWRKAASILPAGTMAGDSAARKMEQAKKLVDRLTADTR